MVLFSTFGWIILLKVLITKITFANNIDSVKKRVDRYDRIKYSKQLGGMGYSLSMGNPITLGISTIGFVVSVIKDSDQNRSLETLDKKEVSELQNKSFNILFWGMLTDYIMTFLVLMSPETISAYLTDLLNSDIAKNAIEALSQGEDWK